jgi:hypothetical protein
MPGGQLACLTGLANLPEQLIAVALQEPPAVKLNAALGGLLDFKLAGTSPGQQGAGGIVGSHCCSCGLECSIALAEIVVVPVVYRY